MITEDYVSFELAKLLKEKGFNDIDCECYGWIGISGKHYSPDDTFYDDEELMEAQEDRKDYIPLITLQMAMKWLRKIHDKFISVEPGAIFGKFDVYVYYDNYTKFKIIERNKDDYEKACEEGIKYCLENLI